MTVSALDRRTTGPIGLGGAPWSVGAEADDSRSREVIGAAVEAGLRLIDTAYAYTTSGVEGHNEGLIRAALSDMPSASRPMIATKGGHYRDGGVWPVDARPATLRAHCDASLRHLGVDVIDLYQLHWPDPAVALLDSVGALEELRQMGKVLRIGVSNVSARQLREVLAQFPISSVQNRLDAADPELAKVIGLCEEAGIVLFGYSPLGGNSASAKALNADPGIASVARRHGASAQQTVLAYWLARSTCIVPLVGARRPGSIVASLQAANVELDREDLVVCQDALERRHWSQ